MARWFTTLIPSLLVFAGCALTTGSVEAPIYPQKQQALDDFKVEQHRFNSKVVLPRTFEFPGQGTVTVRELSLDGYPDNSYVRCRFHYQNTTGKNVVRSLVSLDVLDAHGKMVASQISVLIIPVPIPIAHGSYFADELRTPTRDAHLQPGWSWRLTCRSEFEEPEQDPVPIR
jgi:hypothetical protein